MSLKNQYAGFLDTELLWKHTSLFELSQFDFKKTNKLNDNIFINLPDNEVLGKLIERFFEYYIDRHKNYKLIQKNIQIFKDKTTIGELDFLIEDLRQKQIVHIELIYKFYLYDPKRSGIILERWIGPNRKDSLLEKITKLKEKQLPLLHHPETIARLQALNISAKNIIQEVCFFGNLFIPLSIQNKKISHLNSKCIVGFWIHADEFTSEEYGSYHFYIPKKKEWMVNPKQNKTWHPFKSTSEKLVKELSSKKSSLLWIKSNEDSYSKCFVVWW